MGLGDALGDVTIGLVEIAFEKNWAGTKIPLPQY
jgi:hypothetical protein